MNPQNVWSCESTFLLFIEEMNTKNFLLILILGVVQEGKATASAQSAILNLKVPSFRKERFSTALL